MKTIKKSIFFSLLMIFSFCTAYGQWSQVNTNTNISLNDMFFLDSLEGYCVGGGGFGDSEGMILKTTDGGRSWNFSYNDSMLSVNHIGITDSTILCFGNNNGTPIQLSSIDNGSTWAIDTLSSLINIKDVQTFNNNLYILDESLILSLITESGTSRIIQTNVSFFDVNIYGIVAMGYNADTIYKSMDSGSSWISIPITYKETHISANSFTDAQIALFHDTILLYGNYPAVIAYSYNDGMNWNNNFILANVGSVEIYSPQKIYGLGLDSSNPANSIVNVSTNQGVSWQGVDSLQMDISNAHFSFINENTGFIFGTHGVMYKTTNSVGIQENNFLKKKVKVYPNPAKETLHIEKLEQLNIEELYLTDISGKVVRHFNKKAVNLDVSTLARGTYLLQFKSKEGAFVKKVVLE